MRKRDAEELQRLHRAWATAYSILCPAGVESLTPREVAVLNAYSKPAAKILRDNGIEYTTFTYTVDPVAKAITSIEVREPGESTPTCPDCHGTGEYRGLNAVEPCRTCRKAVQE